MSVLVAVYKDKRRVAGCDARCYGAKNEEAQCGCICGGQNHAMGEAAAIDNTRRRREWMVKPWLEGGANDHHVRLHDLVRQQKLFRR